MFFGLTTRTDAAALAYAVLEGVAFSLVDGHAALEAAGTRLAWLAATGESVADVCTPLGAAERIEPDAALAARLAPRSARYRRLYRNNCNDFG